MAADERAVTESGAREAPAPGAAVARSRHRTLPAVAGFWILAGLFLLLFLASSAASPLYRVYQAQFRFSPTTLTAVFAVYVLVLLLTLLFLGSVSDYLGRLPVIAVALVISVAACSVFLTAHGVGALYVARSLQGLSTGLASGPIGAALIDLQPPESQRAALATSSFSNLGLGLGGLISSVLIRYAPDPTHLIWWALLAVFAVGSVMVPTIAEPGTRRAGVLGALRPTVAVPPSARAVFAAAVPCLVASWALSGFYLSLGPSLTAQTARSTDPLWGGLVIFVLFTAAAVTVLILRDESAGAQLLAGCLSLLGGMAITFGAIATNTTAALFVGAALAGAGFGLVFLGSFRTITGVAGPDQRAGVVAAIYLVGYLAFSVPALIAGVAATSFGLHPTALVYSASVAALAAAATGILLARQARR